MEPAARDELLIRLDERTANIFSLVEKQERHLAQLNEKVASNVLDIAANSSKIQNLEQSGIAIKFTRKQVAVGGSGIVTIIVLVLVELAKLIGWL